MENTRERTHRPPPPRVFSRTHLSRTVRAREASRGGRLVPSRSSSRQRPDVQVSEEAEPGGAEKPPPTFQESTG